MMKKDPYEAYYRGTNVDVGQHLPSPSMERLGQLFKRNNVRRILDFYCGAGRNAIFLAQKGFDVYGFDRSEMALRELRNKQKAATRKVHLRLLGLTGRLPYKSNFFDAVIVIRALYQARVAEIKRDIKEIYRVTKPGGYVYIESDQQYVWRRRNLYGQRKTDEKGTYQHGHGKARQGDYYHYFTKDELWGFFKDFKFIRFYFKDRRFYVLLRR